MKREIGYAVQLFAGCVCITLAVFSESFGASVVFVMMGCALLVAR